MASVGLDVRIEGLRSVRAKMSLLAGRGRDLRTPLRTEVAPALSKHVDRQFVTQGAEGGSSWPGLAAATLRAKQRGLGKYRGGTLQGVLMMTGRLRKSFQRGAKRYVEKIGRQSMEWGSNHPLAHLHAKGVSSGRKGVLPKRELIAFRSESEKQRIVGEPVVRYVVGDLAD